MNEPYDNRPGGPSERAERQGDGPVRRIVVVGGGASAVLVATQILSLAQGALSLVVIGGRGRRGRGVAYNTPHSEHLLNVRAGRMSAVPGDAGHFARWLRLHHGDDRFDEHSFAPRTTYGDYLASVLATSIPAAHAAVRFQWIDDEAADLAVEDERVRVWLRQGGQPLVADHAVLAVGDVSSRAEPPPPHLTNPWTGGAFEQLDPDRPVLVLGTSLTMVDVALALRKKGHRGGIWAVSRHGLAPQAQSDVGCAGASIEMLAVPPRSARSWTSFIRSATRAASREGCHWQCVFERLRPYVSVMWKGLPGAERRRFLRHLRPYWDVHRHRLPPSLALLVERMQKRGYLKLRAGRLLDLSPESDGLRVTIAPRGAEEVWTVAVQRAFDATGSGYGDSSSPLAARLVERGLVRPGPLGLGWDATTEGSLIGGDGHASALLSTLGSPLRGVLWETTAIPEIREQARSLAARLSADAPTGARSASMSMYTT
jgi:uncharacterized NAD(P)/FAD-binding protein YdhS